VSDDVKLSLTKAGIVIGLLAGLAGLLGAWFVLPYRVSAAENAIREVQTQARTDHDLIQRIDERTARMEKAIDRLVP
jgi:hypothetical protein